MKQLTLLLLVLSVNTYAQVSVQETSFAKAYGLYKKGMLDSSLQVFSTIEESGYESPELYYNIGNIYFKKKEYAYAILYFEKALKLNPSDEDIAYNISIANSHIVDKIETMPEFFLTQWITNIRNYYSPNQWAFISLSVLVLTFALILTILLVRIIAIRKIALVLSLLSFVLFVFSTYFGVSSHNFYKNTSHGIIVAPSVVVKSSPDESGSDLFVLHEGTKVNIKETFDQWSEIKIADGNKGWVLSSSYKEI